MRWAITGGAGFLGLHLARRLLADGHEVRTLDLAPLDDAELERSVEELRGDVRDPVAAARLADGADVLVHAAAALPIQASRDSIRSVNVEGTAVVLAAALEAGVRRAVLISSTAVYGVPKHHPIDETSPLVGVGHYGESKIEAEQVARRRSGRRGLEVVILRPKTFIGPERLGVFEILFDWIREGRRIPILGDGSNRYQLLAVEDLVEATVRRGERAGRRRDLQRRRDRVRHRPLRPRGPDRARRLGQSPTPGACAAGRARPTGARAGAALAARRMALPHRAPRLLRRDGKAQRLLGFAPRLSNEEALCETYDWYLANRGRVGEAGVTHRVPWDQRALGLLKRLS